MLPRALTAALASSMHSSVPEHWLLRCLELGQACTSSLWEGVPGHKYTDALCGALVMQTVSSCAVHAMQKMSHPTKRDSISIARHPAAPGVPVGR